MCWPCPGPRASPHAHACAIRVLSALSERITAPSFQRSVCEVAGSRRTFPSTPRARLASETAPFQGYSSRRVMAGEQMGTQMTRLNGNRRCSETHVASAKGRAATQEPRGGQRTSLERGVLPPEAVAWASEAVASGSCPAGPSETP